MCRTAIRTMLSGIAQLCPRKRGRSKNTWRSEPGKGVPFRDQMTNLRTLQLVQLLRRVMRLPLGFCVPLTCPVGGMHTGCPCSFRGSYKLLR